MNRRRFLKALAAIPVVTVAGTSLGKTPAGLITDSQLRAVITAIREALARAPYVIVRGGLASLPASVVIKDEK